MWIKLGFLTILCQHVCCKNGINNKETKSLIKVELVKSPVFELAARKESANNKRNLSDSGEKNGVYLLLSQFLKSDLKCVRLTVYFNHGGSIHAKRYPFLGRSHLS